jgi:hypothetical protein
MRTLSIAVVVASLFGCAGSGSHSQAGEPARAFRNLDGTYEIYVRLESQPALSGTLKIFASDTAHGIYTGDLTLEEIAFIGDIFVYSESTPRREVRVVLRPWFNRRAAGSYASLVLFPTDGDEVAGRVSLHSPSATCDRTSLSSDGGYAGDQLLASLLGRNPTNPPPSAVASSRCPSLGGTLRVVER